MKITVKLFAILRDRAGFAETHVEVAPGISALDASRDLSVQFPALTPLISKIAYAINEQYVPPETILHDGDELALIPPVSGG